MTKCDVYATLVSASVLSLTTTTTIHNAHVWRWFSVQVGLVCRVRARPVERGEGGKFSQAPRRLGARRRSKILKKMFQMASFWPKICIKSICGRDSAPDPAWGAYDAPPDP